MLRLLSGPTRPAVLGLPAVLWCPPDPGPHHSSSSRSSRAVKYAAWHQGAAADPLQHQQQRGGGLEPKALPQAVLHTSRATRSSSTSSSNSRRERVRC